MARKWCHRCQQQGHVKRDCPRGRLRVVPGPGASPAPPVAENSQVSDPWDLSHQPRINQQPDLSAAHAYWDTAAPLVSIYEAWDGPGAESPAEIAREMRLRAMAARQVEESRAARGVL